MKWMKREGGREKLSKGGGELLSCLSSAASFLHRRASVFCCERFSPPEQGFFQLLWEDWSISLFLFCLRSFVFPHGGKFHPALKWKKRCEGLSQHRSTGEAKRGDGEGGGKCQRAGGVGALRGAGEPERGGWRLQRKLQQRLHPDKTASQSPR